MKVGEKINFLLKKTAMTKAELARRMGLRDSSVVSHWVKNRWSPDSENMKKMADVFDKPLSYFTDDDGSLEDDKKFYDSLMLPQISVKHIGVLGEISSKIFDVPFYSPAEEYLPVLIDTEDNKKPFALKIQSADVYYGARAGDYIIIMPSEMAAEGKVALVKSREGCVFKKISDKKQGLKPGSEILGQVIGFFRKP